MIDENYFEEGENITDDLIQMCETKPNKLKNNTNELNKNIRTTSIENGLLSQVC